jgi:hypothetical protein
MEFYLRTRTRPYVHVGLHAYIRAFIFTLPPFEFHGMQLIM